MGYGVDRNETADGSGAAVTPVQLTLFTAKGDLAVATGNAAVDNLPVGANDTILMAASGQATGLKWATPSEVAAAVANGATAETAPAVADKIALYDASVAAGRGMTLENLFKVINSLTEIASGALLGADVLLVYDAANASAKRVTVNNLLEIIDDYSEDTSALAADFLLSYDTSASAPKKVSLAKLPGQWELINTYTPSAVASQAITGFDSTRYTDYRIVLNDILPATDNVSFRLRTSTDGGSSYDSGASDYSWGSTYSGAGANGGGNNNSNATSSILLTGGNAVGNAAGEGISGIIDIVNPGAAARCRVLGTFQNVSPTGMEMTLVTTGRRLAAADVNGIEFSFDSGNIASGTIRFYGLRKPA